MSELIYAVIIFFLVSGTILLALGWRDARHEMTEGTAAKLQRIRERRGALTAALLEDGAEAEMQREFAKQQEANAAQQRAGAMISLDSIVNSFRVTARLEHDLQQLGSFWHASEMLTASSIVALLVLFILTALGWAFVAVPLAILCLFSPWIYARSMRLRYLRRFESQLADTLMLMSNSLRAGFSFLQAMEMIAREAPQPISGEFQMVTQEIAVGVPITQALENLADRLKSPDLDLMVTAVVIQRETGGAMAEILDIIASVIQERMTIRGEIRTLTTQGKLTGIILGLLPIFLGLVLHLVSRASAPGQPSFVMPLIETQVGNMFLAGALVMQILGFIWILKIVTIKV